MVQVSWLALLALVQQAASLALLSDRTNSTHIKKLTPHSQTLHVVFASNLQQVDGLLAAITSLVQHSQHPKELRIHVLSEFKNLPSLKVQLGIAAKAAHTRLVTGTRLHLHGFHKSQIAKGMTKVVEVVGEPRKELETPENFARFYSHLFLPPDVEAFVYLDADVIVQADLAQMRDELLASGKTLAFARRPPRQGTFFMRRVLKRPQHCEFTAKSRWSTMMFKQEYNAGVLAINLKRWKSTHVLDRLEQVAADHNKCDGGIFAGGSQPLLLLTLYNHPRSEPDDFYLLGSSWNFGRLGWSTQFEESLLAKQKVLHWSGARKPWLKDALYKQFWSPYHYCYNSLLRGGTSSTSRSSSNCKLDFSS